MSECRGVFRSIDWDSWVLKGCGFFGSGWCVFVGSGLRVFCGC